MKWEKWGITITTGKDAEQMEQKPLSQFTDEQIAEMMKSKAFLRSRPWETEPSSKEGRDLYWSRVSWFEAPFDLWQSFKEWLNGDQVWYSPEGVRHVTHFVRRKE